VTVFNKKGDSLEINIRLARPGEAPKLISLLKKQHGANYEEQLYDEEFVSNAIESGVLRVVIAELPGGSLAGMIGADTENEFTGSIAVGQFTLDPVVRGFGVGKSIYRFLLQTIPQDMYTCIYSHFMSIDAVSQTIGKCFGYRITGLLLNRSSNDPGAEYMAGLSLPFKETLVVGCIPRIKKDAGILYAPAAHTGFIAKVYESLGVVYTLNGENRRSETPQSVLSINQDEQHRYCEIIVKAPGLDLTNKIDEILGQYTDSEQSFNIFINSSDPGCGNACRILEERGFFFTGIQALSGLYEYVIMHYSLSLPVAFDKIVVIPEFEEQFNYIQTKYKEAKHDRKN
jgi:hypothetical protein